jgi:hypothetical protein
MCNVSPVLSPRSSTRSEFGGGLATVVVATMFIPLLISIPGATSCVDAALAVDLPTSLVATIISMKLHESPYKSRRHIHGPSGLTLVMRANRLLGVGGR